MTETSAWRWALLSIGAAVLTIALKVAAWRLTDSIGLLSDAAESGVNFLAAVVALWALRRASRPADATYAFGHSKAEYFASGFEGLMILAASVAIAVAAVERLKAPLPIANVGLGLAISVAASLVNGAVALVLLRAAKRLRSITLRADAQHLLTDVWTSAGVLVGVLLVKLTGWLLLDPLVALLVAANIVYTAVRLLQETGHGLLDRAIGEDERAAMEAALAPFRARGIVFHDVRTRRAGPRHFIQMHVLVPGTWTVQKGHDVCEQVERAVVQDLAGSVVTTHLEPVEDPRSWNEDPFGG